MADLLSPTDIERLLAGLPDWKRADGTISREFEFDTFTSAIAFVEAVAGIAEEIDHHPDIDIRYRKVLIAVSTHSAGGLTDLDFSLAGRCDELF